MVLEPINKSNKKKKATKQKLDRNQKDENKTRREFAVLPFGATQKILAARMKQKRKQILE